MIYKYLIIILGVIVYGASHKNAELSEKETVPSLLITKTKNAKSAQLPETSQWEIWSEAVDLDLKVKMTKMEIEQLQEQVRILDAYELKLIAECSIIGKPYNMVLIDRISDEIKERRIKAKSRLERLELKIRQAKGYRDKHAMGPSVKITKWKPKS